jgi:hypothetical protein
MKESGRSGTEAAAHRLPTVGSRSVSILPWPLTLTIGRRGRAERTLVPAVSEVAGSSVNDTLPMACLLASVALLLATGPFRDSDAVSLSHFDVVYFRHLDTKATVVWGIRVRSSAVCNHTHSHNTRRASLLVQNTTTHVIWLLFIPAHTSLALARCCFAAAHKSGQFEPASRPDLHVHG